MIELIGAQPTDFARNVLYFVSTHQAFFQQARIAIVVRLQSARHGKATLASILAEQSDLPDTSP